MACEKCGSNNVVYRGKLFNFLVMFLGGGTLMWLTIFFPFMLAVAIGFIIASPLAFLMPGVEQCKNCNHCKVIRK
jgi:hypothetical protein